MGTHGLKIVGDTRDPFLVKQLDDQKDKVAEVQKQRDKYFNELCAIARELHCYAADKAIIREIRKLKEQEG